MLDLMQAQETRPPKWRDQGARRSGANVMPLGRSPLVADRLGALGGSMGKLGDLYPAVIEK